MAMPQGDQQVLDISQILEQVPGIVFRFSHEDDNWKTWLVTRNVSMSGCDAEGFLANRIRRMDNVHPDDRVLLNDVLIRLHGFVSNPIEAHKLNAILERWLPEKKVRNNRPRIHIFYKPQRYATVSECGHTPVF